MGIICSPATSLGPDDLSLPCFLTMIQLFDNSLSANCYKVKLLLTQLGIPFRTHEISVLGDRDKDRGAEFFAKNPIGKIPTVVLEDGTSIGESLALLYYFAEGTPFLPEDRLERARVLQWLAFEQNNLEPTLATARHLIGHRGYEPGEELLGVWTEGGNRVLRVLDGWLNDHDWLACGRYTIADIACFGYTHCCEEGPFSLEPYPAVRAWMERVKGTERFVPMG